MTGALIIAGDMQTDTTTLEDSSKLLLHSDLAIILFDIYSKELKTCTYTGACT